MFNKLTYFISKITKIEEQFIKFLFVGMLNTIFGYTIYAFFVFIGFGYILAPLFSTIAGIIFNFKTTGIIVFNSKKNSLFFKFFFVYVLSYILSVIFLKLFIICGVSNLYISGFIVTILMAFFNYTMNKHFVFNKK